MSKNRVLALEARQESDINSQNFNVDNYSYYEMQDETIMAKADDSDEVPDPTIKSVNLKHQHQPSSKQTSATVNYTEGEIYKIGEQIKKVDSVLDKGEVFIKQVDTNLKIDEAGFNNYYTHHHKHSRHGSHAN